MSKYLDRLEQLENEYLRKRDTDAELSAEKKMDNYRSRACFKCFGTGWYETYEDPNFKCHICGGSGIEQDEY